MNSASTANDVCRQEKTGGVGVLRVVGKLSCAADLQVRYGKLGSGFHVSIHSWHE